MKRALAPPGKAAVTRTMPLGVVRRSALALTFGLTATSCSSSTTTPPGDGGVMPALGDAAPGPTRDAAVPQADAEADGNAAGAADAALAEAASPLVDAAVAPASATGLFDVPEPWTKDVSGLAKDARSDAIVAALAASGGFGNGDALAIDFSIPLFFADAATPRRPVVAQPANAYCYGGADCDPVPLAMPIPPSGHAEGSSSYICDVTYGTPGQGDCHLLVMATDEKKLYELYNFTVQGGAYTALGAFVWDAKKAYPDNLRGDQCTSADAAGFPIAALLPTADEVASGQVNHAIRFILPNERMLAKSYVHPATHAGSPSSKDPNAPPYGVRLRLRAGFDETAYGPGERALLTAMKTYGMLLSDGGTIALTFADDGASTAKWAALGVTASSFHAIGAKSFEVIDLGEAIALTDNCVRN